MILEGYSIQYLIINSLYIIVFHSKMSCKTISLHIDLVYKPLIDERSHRNLYKQCRRFKIASQVIKIEIPTDYVLEFPDSSDQVSQHSSKFFLIDFLYFPPRLLY